ncbi:hypothetical protein DV515_00001332 [Chloebia gouldiae]|uniref:Uncharacterized protein n=1 Tax=Chloebia gouldiae TaxID=44316 RepID=A0A3L8SYM8_CHLGU|nr:hypothetical protein DV515_00001332 [Chloebia gouldiae]
MSTEDKSLVVAVVEPPQQQQQPPEPGAPPPAAAAAATDKRPRGRPRKDGASPFQRARKKKTRFSAGGGQDTPAHTRS